MVDVETFLRLIDAYAAATASTDAAVGKRLFNDGKGVKRLRDGGDIGARKLAEKLAWLAEHWPPHEPWPVGIPRPAFDTHPPLAEAVAQ